MHVGSRERDRDRPEIRAARRWHGSGARGVALAGGALAVAIGAGAVVLGPVALHHPAYPAGWDAPFYVGRIHLVQIPGLREVGLIRVASPLLMASFSTLSGANAMTALTVASGAFAALLALAMAALGRTALRLGAVGCLDPQSQRLD